MKSITISATIIALASFVAAVPPFDPNGAKSVGNGKGAQFITGQCLSDADCASGCCAKPTGICSGPGASTQQGKEGCGFGGGGDASPAPAAAPADPSAATPADPTATPADPAAGGDDGGADNGAAAPADSSATPPADAGANNAAAAPATASKGGPAFDPSGTKNVGNGKGAQFIGGQCLTTADCASGCCAGPSGICSGLGAQNQAGKTGCGFKAKRFISVRSSLVELD